MKMMIIQLHSATKKSTMTVASDLNCCDMKMEEMLAKYVADINPVKAGML